MNSHIYVVYDEKDRIVSMYKSYTWACRKAEKTKGLRIESYVHTENRRALEIEEWFTRNRTKGGLKK